MKISEHVYGKLIWNWTKVINLNIIHSKIVHYNVDKKRFLKDFLFDLKLNPQFDISIKQSLTYGLRVISNKLETFLLFDFLKMKFFIFQNDLIAYFFSICDLEKLALLGFFTHVVPHTNCSTFLEWPSHFFFQSYSFTPV